jgi:glycosyltransferase involved in cell wall biosynthesis
MKVLQVHARYRHEAGEDAVVDAEGALLRSAGHEVVPFHTESPSSLPAAATSLLTSSWNVAAARRVDEAVRQHRPDVAHVHNTWFALSGSVLEHIDRAGVPVVMTLHNYRLGCISRDLFRDGAPCTRCLGRSPAPGVRHRCYKGSYAASAVAAVELVVHRTRRTMQRNVDRFVAPSEFAADLLVRAGVDASSITVKPHFTHDPGPRLGPPSASAEVLYVGRLAPGKGVEELLSAWQRSPRPGLRLVLVGDGPLRAALEEQVPAGVELSGWLPRDDVLARMRSARALVFPSTWYEPFGMVLIEALAAGLPVVGFGAGAARQIVRPEPPELLVPVGDADALAKALDRLHEDPFVDEVGHRSRARFEAAFTPEQNLPALESIYRSVT